MSIARIESTPKFSIDQHERERLRPASTDAVSEGIALSVLTPVYNERHLVAASLARVLAFKSGLVSDLQLIVVDDCSTDGSFELLEQLARTDPRIQLHRHERNLGKGAAIRTVLQYATGDVCVVHDAVGIGVKR
jgi:glycosyltransferase involved in cell wall biosynthesis